MVLSNLSIGSLIKEIVSMLRLVSCLSSKYSNLKVPAVDVARFLQRSPGWEQDCKEVAEAFKTYGLLVIKDPRVNPQQNNNFLNLMERYFVKRSKQFHNGERDIDFSPESNFQVGIMHEYQEKFQSYEEEKRALKPPHHSLTPI